MNYIEGEISGNYTFDEFYSQNDPYKVQPCTNACGFPYEKLGGNTFEIPYHYTLTNKDSPYPESRNYTESRMLDSPRVYDYPRTLNPKIEGFNDLWSFLSGMDKVTLIFLFMLIILIVINIQILFMFQSFCKKMSRYSCQHVC
ncbi:MAG: hypothetical protein QW303_02050 [Nitrososphaerota archaeon]